MTQIPFLEHLEGRRLLATGPVVYGHSVTGRLFTVDCATAQATLIGDTKRQVYDIAVSPDGVLYGTNGSELFRIDRTTAATTDIGDIGVVINGLEFSAGGELFGAGNSLYSINPQTGFATLRGDLGTYSSAGDLAFSENGDLFLTTKSDDLVKVNPSNGVTTLVGPLGFSSVLGLALGADNQLYGGTNSSQVIRINTATGAGTLIGTINQPSIGGMSRLPMSGAVDADDQIGEALALGSMTVDRSALNASISNASDVDMYSFQVASGQRINFDIDRPSGTFDSLLRIFSYNASNNFATQLAVNDNAVAPNESLGTDSYLSCTFATAGTYYVGVSGSPNFDYGPVSGNDGRAGSTGSYSLFLSGTSQPEIQVLSPAGGGPRFNISANGVMPHITFGISGIPDAVKSTLEVTWTVNVRLKAEYDKPYGRDVPGFSKTIKQIGTTFTPEWPNKPVGGKLTVTAEYNLNGAGILLIANNLKIGGKNPTPEDLAAYMNAFPPPGNWPQVDGYDYNQILRQIARFESKSLLQQFKPNGYPLWNENGTPSIADKAKGLKGDGGVGIMQYTNRGDPNYPTYGKPEIVWDWKANVRAGITTFGQKIDNAFGPPSTWPSRHLKNITGVLKSLQIQKGLALPIKTQVFNRAMLIRDAVEQYHGGHKYAILPEDAPASAIQLMDNGDGSATALWQDVSSRYYEKVRNGADF